MRGNDTIIKHLNTVLGNELVAINQYFLHAKILKDRGLTKLAEVEYHESIDEMKHADKLVERILFLEGMPNLQDLGRLSIGETVEEMLQADLKLELISHADLKAGIEDCEKHQDYIARDLLKTILDDEEEHIDWLETQLGLIQQLGLANYLQSQVSAAE